MHHDVFGMYHDVRVVVRTSEKVSRDYGVQRGKESEAPRESSASFKHVT